MTSDNMSEQPCIDDSERPLCEVLEMVEERRGTEYNSLISILLVGIEQEELIPIFERARVDMSTFLELTAEDLEYFGVPAACRQAVLDGIKLFRGYEPASPAPLEEDVLLNVFDVYKIIKNMHNVLEQYKTCLDHLASKDVKKEAVWTTEGQDFSDLVSEYNKKAKVHMLCFNEQLERLKSVNRELHSEFLAESDYELFTRNPKSRCSLRKLLLFGAAAAAVLSIGVYTFRNYRTLSIVNRVSSFITMLVTRQNANS